MELLLDKDHLKYYNQDLFTKAAIQTLYDAALEDDAFRKLFLTRDSLLKEKNIVLRNAVAFFLYKLSSPKIREDAKSKKTEIFSRLHSMNYSMAEIASKKIQNNSEVFVHSINNQITQLLLHSAKHRKFTLNLIEHAPLNFGKALSKKLEGKANVYLFPDMALKEAIQGSDVCFIGAESITDEKGAVVKTGSTMASELCKQHHIPVYVCAHSWKYDPNNMSGLLELKPKFEDYAPSKMYEYLKPEHITAYVIDHGIFKPDHVEKEIKFMNNWIG